MAPVDLTLWDEHSGHGAAWVEHRQLRRGPAVIVDGVEDELVFRPKLTGGGRLRLGDQAVASVVPRHDRDGLTLDISLAERLDLMPYAAGVATVAAWLVCVDLLLPRGARAGSGP